MLNARSLVILALGAVLLASSACDGRPRCAFSVGACASHGACGIDVDDCSDGVARKLRCTPTTEMPMKCDCLVNGEMAKVVELDQSASEVALNEAAAFVNHQCGWAVR